MSRIVVKLSLAVLLFVPAAVLFPAMAEEPFDVVLAGGRVIDPETGLDAVRDVGIRDGKIVAITDGSLATSTRRTRSAASTGCVHGWIWRAKLKTSLTIGSFGWNSKLSTSANKDERSSVEFGSK